MLRPYIYLLLTNIFMFIEKLKGDRVIRPLDKLVEDYSIIRVMTVFGYEVEFHIERRQFKCFYASAFFRNKVLQTYEVRCIVDKYAPDRIKEAFSKVYTFPKMLPTFIPLNIHAERAMNSYLDIVIHDAIQIKQ